MPQRDLYHEVVVDALEKDHWNITADPLFLKYGDKRLYIDLGAEPLVGAQKDHQKIAVEIKSFIGSSSIEELELAIGQYNLYRDVLSELEPDRELYLAIPEFAYTDVFTDLLGNLIVKRQQLRLIVFDEERKEIIRWINP